MNRSTKFKNMKKEISYSNNTATCEFLRYVNINDLFKNMNDHFDKEIEELNNSVDKIHGRFNLYLNDEVKNSMVYLFDHYKIKIDNLKSAIESEYNLRGYGQIKVSFHRPNQIIYLDKIDTSKETIIVYAELLEDDF